MISRKLHQHKGKLRQVFRGLDTERSNTIDRPAFLKAVGSLRISLQPKQVERLYSIVDANNGSSGKINYEAFVGSFDRSERPRVSWELPEVPDQPIKPIKPRAEFLAGSLVSQTGGMVFANGCTKRSP